MNVEILKSDSFCGNTMNSSLYISVSPEDFKMDFYCNLNPDKYRLSAKLHYPLSFVTSMKVLKEIIKHVPCI